MDHCPRTPVSPCSQVMFPPPTPAPLPGCPGALLSAASLLPSILTEVYLPLTDHAWSGPRYICHIKKKKIYMYFKFLNLTSISNPIWLVMDIEVLINLG